MLTIHDHERTPADRLTCEWGALASIGSGIASGATTAGTAAANAAAAAGSALGSAASGLAQESGLSSLYNAGAGLLGGGGGGGGGAPLLNGAGQPVEMAGMHPSMMDTGPGFMNGFANGMSGVLNRYAEPSVGTLAGQGLGLLGNFIDQGRGMGNMSAGQWLRSGLSAYGLGDGGGVRPYAGGAPPQAQRGLLSLDLFGNTGVS